MKPYQSPALWSADDTKLVEKLPAYLTDPDEQAAWLASEAERRNQIILNASLGKKTGWPAKWLEEIKSEPTGDGWKAAFGRGLAVLDNHGILILHGKRGPGKTRMAAELSLYAGKTRYRTAMRFFLEIRATYRNKDVSEMEIIDDLVAANLLVLDELQERGETPFEDRLLTHLIDARYAENKPTILIANYTATELAAALGFSVVDRVRENGATIEFTWPSFRKPQPPKP